jgi:hypothetical protein
VPEVAKKLERNERKDVSRVSTVLPPLQMNELLVAKTKAKAKARLMHKLSDQWEDPTC